MLKLLYLSTWDFTNEESEGVCKKIYSQIDVFEKEGYQVDFIYLKNNEIMYREDGKVRSMGAVGAIKKTPAYIKMYGVLKEKKYDWVFNRYGMMDTFYFRVLKTLKKNGAKILIELPTYPYTGEKNKGLMYWLMFKWDEVYQKKLKDVVERIVTYSRDEEIWGIKTIQIKNGVNLNEIPRVCLEAKTDNSIHLLAVALMQPYHGYERLLWGLKHYYENGGKRKVYCHFVGEGPEKATYEKIVAEKKLEEYVVFYGKKAGEELNRIYNKVDLGVCSLGCYKKGIYWSSELKSREYMARGLPFIIGVKLDIADELDEKFFMEFPNDATMLDICKIIEFHDEVYKNGREEVIRCMHAEAKERISMETTLNPIRNYIKE